MKYIFRIFCFAKLIAKFDNIQQNVTFFANIAKFDDEMLQFGN